MIEDFLEGDLTRTEFRENSNEMMINYTTLLIILFQKKIIKKEEIMRARAKAVHIIDQEDAKIRESKVARLEEKFPGVRKMIDEALEDLLDGDA